MRKGFCIVWSALAIFCSCVLGAVGYLQQALPDRVTVSEGERFHIGVWVQEQTPFAGRTMAASATKAGEEYRTRLTLAGLFPIKETAVSVVDTPVVMVCGTPFGIKLYTDGVLIVGMSDVMTAAGGVNPAAAAGVCVGDTILAIDGRAVTTNREVSRLINACEGRPVTLRLRRDGVEFEATFTPARAADEPGYRAGLWVRDSTAGVGILTFYDPDTGVFGGLGHPVCDTDTGTQLTISGGEIVPARIYEVEKSVAGQPGELCGGFEIGTLGRLHKNAADGLFGKLTVIPAGGQTMPVALKQQVKPGPAQILTTLEGTRPQLYDIVIEQVRYNASSTRNMVVRITDQRLLATAGGIVQGMSGSPIVQNGKLVGAVTHVLVDTPEKGYAVFAETMLETAQGVEKEQLKNVS